jgi:energy-coupling factor transport system ATP-binding protein
VIQIKPFQFTYATAFDQLKPQLFCNEAFELQDQKLHLITGPSGSGKSTLLNFFNQLIPQEIKGQLSGRAPRVECARHEVACLFQNPFNQIIHSNPYLELAFVSENKKLNRKIYFEKMQLLCQQLGLENLTGKNTNQLSHGEAQKLLLASLLVSELKVLLLDEPTAFMDQKSRLFFYELLNVLKEKFLIVLVDHYLPEALRIADSVTSVALNGVISSGYQTQNSNPVKKESLIQIVKPATNIYKIDVQNLSYRYHKSWVLKDVDFQCSSGDIVAISGKNGSGKTTFLKLLAQFLIPTSGQVQHFLNTKKLNTSKIHDELGFVLQNSDDNFYYDTLEEEFENKESLQYSNLMLDRNHFKKSPLFLSEGEKRRAALLIQLNLDKKVIFYDEPTYGQDQENQNILLQAMRELQQQGVLQIIISHDEEFVKKISTHIYQIENCQMVLKGGG